MTILAAVAALLGLSASAAETSALTRCQCSSPDWIGGCSASVSQEGNWITITSDTTQCSRVDFYLDGEPQTIIVTDGKEAVEWLGQSRSPQLIVQSCKICKDAVRSAGQSGETGSASEGQTNPPIATSPFQGVWIGEDRNVYGYSHATRVEINVQGNQITGTWSSQRDAPISGTVDGRKARIKIQGGASATLELVNDATIKSRWMFGTVVLKKKE